MERTEPTWADLERAMDVAHWAHELAGNRSDEWFVEAASDAADRMRALFDERPDLRDRFMALADDDDPDGQRAAFAQLEADLAALRAFFSGLIPPPDETAR